MLTSIIKRAAAVFVVGCSILGVAGCGGSNPGAPVAQSEAEQQNKLTEQGVKSAPATDEAAKQNQLTGGTPQGK